MGRARAARAGGVALFGDLPFMVSGDSADVWARQDEFRLDASVGVPPDAFSETGQDWGLPVYRWDVLAERDFDWLRDRARRNADLFDGYRVDHLVGFYRTYFRPHDGGDAAVHARRSRTRRSRSASACSASSASRAPRSSPRISASSPTSSASRSRGCRCPATRCFAGSASGTSRASRSRIPADYPAVSVATSGTHDTEPMVDLVGGRAARGAGGGARDSVGARPAHATRIVARRSTRQACRTPVHEALLETLFASGSDTLILPIQDVFGWRDRINQPATVGDANWTWRLPWPTDRLTHGAGGDRGRESAERNGAAYRT